MALAIAGLLLNEAVLAQSNSLFRLGREQRNQRPAPGASVGRPSANLLVPAAATQVIRSQPARPLEPVSQQAQGAPAAPNAGAQVSTDPERPASPAGSIPSQQAGGTAQFALPGVPGPEQNGPAGFHDPQVDANPTLLALSSIAVPVPKKEKLATGALVTIIVREIKQSLSDSNLRSQKQWDVAAAVAKWIRLDNKHHLVPQAFPQGDPEIELGLKDNYQGKGRVDRRDELTTRITAIVIDVKPNGTLVLEARKSIALDEETQVYTLTGKCRVEDLTPQNTILSTQLADLELNVQHEGAARDAARRSIWKKLSDLFQLS